MPRLRRSGSQALSPSRSFSFRLPRGGANIAESSPALDWFPTFVAAAGKPNITEELLKGKLIGDRTYKNHLDGYNQMECITGILIGSSINSRASCSSSSSLARKLSFPTDAAGRELQSRRSESGNIEKNGRGGGSE
jgi:hypothetical protein